VCQPHPCSDLWLSVQRTEKNSTPTSLWTKTSMKQSKPELGGLPQDGQPAPMLKRSSAGCIRTMGPSLFVWHLNLRVKPQEQASRPTPSRLAPPVSRLLSSSLTRRFATPLTYPLLGLIQLHTRINETTILINHQERDEIFACLSKEYLSFILDAKYSLPLELYDRVT
jgi:hypothetical protein